MEFEEWRCQKGYRLIGEYNGDKFELSRNIPTIELAERLREDIERLYPFFGDITIKECITYLL